MKWILAIGLVLCVLNLSKAVSTTNIVRINFYEEAKNEDFSSEELELLKPIIDNLNAQYDVIFSKAVENENSQTNIGFDKHLKDLLMTVVQDVSEEDEFSNTAFAYNTKLPTLNDLKGSLMTEVPAAELHDMESIFQENIDEAEQAIQSLVERSNETTATLISINKIKILKFIYKMMGNIFSIGIRVSRAAYCTYSYVPIINSTLTEGRTNIGSCYIQTRNTIRQLRNDVQTSIDDIRANVMEIVKIYKKIASRESLLGKLFTLLMNASKIRNDITDSRAVALQTIGEVKTGVPALAASAKECSQYSIPSFVKQLNETITGLTTCINFVDDSTQGPEPEPESEESSEEEEDPDLLLRFSRD